MRNKLFGINGLEGSGCIATGHVRDTDVCRIDALRRAAFVLAEGVNSPVFRLPTGVTAKEQILSLSRDLHVSLPHHLVLMSIPPDGLMMRV